MKRLASIAGAVLALLCLGYFVVALRTHWEAIRAIATGPGALAGMAVALVLYAATYLAGAKSWQLVLRTMGHAIEYRASLSIIAVSQLAKYLPGNVGHHFGRVLLARRAGLPADVTLTSVFLDTLLALGAAVACAFGAWHLWPAIAALHGDALARNLAIAACAGIVLVALGFALRATRRHAHALLQRAAALFRSGHRGASLMAWVSYLCSFALGAGALAAIAGGLHAATPPMLEVLAVYAIAWLVGFLVPGAPAGLGVREAILIFGLSPLLGRDVATATTALMRVVTVAGDGLVFLLGSALSPRAAQAAT